MTLLKIALTKGHLEKRTVALLEKMGYDCSQVHNKDGRPILSVGDGETEVVLAKAVDAVTYAQHGACDLGIVGKDTIMGNTGGFFEVLDLSFGKRRSAVTGLKDSGTFGGYSVKTMATKYPKVIRAFFENCDMDVHVIRIEDSVELASLLGPAEAIVDLVGAGTTLKENGLEILEIIYPISTRLIVNLAVMKLGKNEVEALVSRMSQAIQKREEKVCLK